MEDTWNTEILPELTPLEGDRRLLRAYSALCRICSGLDLAQGGHLLRRSNRDSYLVVQRTRN